MKKIIYIFGVIFLAIIIILNLIFTTYLNPAEETIISFNSASYIIGLIAAGILMVVATKFINDKLYKDEQSKKLKIIRKILFITALVIYIAFNVVWTIFVNPPVVADSIHVSNLAQTMYRGNPEEFLPNLTYIGIPLSEYIQAYPQQISLAFIYSLFFRLIQFDVLETLRVLNVIGNLLIVIALYKIGNQLAKKYKTNKVLLLTLILTFISLPMLSTFIYGDIPSIALCLFAVYFMMRYTETKKIRFAVGASIFTMIAYMMRMNSLIFIIATVMYLVLNLINGFMKKELKENLINVGVIIVYLVVSMIPATLVQNYYLDKYDLEKDKRYPSISYFFMGMEESRRGNGWYNEDIAEPALKDPEMAKNEYGNRIKEKLSYFISQPGYTFNFYVMKIASMWTENTYSAVRSNQDGTDMPIENMTGALTFYQKMLLIITCLCSLIVMIQNRKNLSLDVLFLITIFIGGFAFHVLWEAKSRYIIPYILVLIPVASIYINNLEIKEKIMKIYNKKNERNLN